MAPASSSPPPAHIAVPAGWGRQLPEIPQQQLLAAELFLFCVFHHRPKLLCILRLPLFVHARWQINIRLPLDDKREGTGNGARDISDDMPLRKAHQ